MGRWAPAIIGLLLLGAGAVLLTVGLLTPQYTDAHAYDAALEGLTRQHAIGIIGQDPAIDAFYDLQDRFNTRRWFYVDLGWSALALSALAFVVFIARVANQPLTTREPAVVLPATALALGLFFMGLAANPFLAARREQLPMWAELIGIPIFWAAVVTAVLAPILALLALPSLYFGREARGLFRSGRGWIATVIATVLYLPPLAGALFVLSEATYPGGSILILSAGLIIWLLLNARAHWLGLKAQP